MKIPPFKIHCSAIHSIMATVTVATIDDLEAAKTELAGAVHVEANKPNKTNAKAVESAKRKVEKIETALKTQTGIPVGAEKVAMDWFKLHLYGKQKPHIGSKYTDKGNECEWEAIYELGRIDKQPYAKNTETFENSHFVGTPDVIWDIPIIDTKNSWSCYTFPVEIRELNKDYWWQVQGYMDLMGKRQAEVVYMLLDPSDEIIEREVRAEAIRQGILISEDLRQSVRDRLLNKRPEGISDAAWQEMTIKRFPVEYDADAVQAVKNRVEACREWLQRTFKNTIFEQFF